MEQKIQLTRNDNAAHTREMPSSLSARRRATVVFLLFLLLVLSVLQSGCDAFFHTVPPSKKGTVAVMTRNVYVGADVNSVLGVTLGEIPVAVAQFFAHVQETNFAERARAMADEIESAGPDLVALQEVALFRIQSPGDYLDGERSPNAEEVAQDFLSMLMQELNVRELRYRVVNVVENADIELPATTNGRDFFDLRLTDRDVILARREVQVNRSEAHHFETNLPLPLVDSKGDPLPLLRGFGTVAATVRGLSLTFVNTHLETAAFADVQVAQAEELIGAVRNIEGPVVLAGDFNSAAPGAATPVLDTETYGMMAAAYTDAYLAAEPGEVGYTCCQAADLTNVDSQLAWRIDQIWHDDRTDALLATVLGDEPADRTPGGLWPSDHAGVAALLRIDRHAP